MELNMHDIKDKLARLRQRDSECMLFGSKKHRYESTVIPENEIAAFERDLKHELPKEYRDYLMHIGFGAGPGYGLYSLDAIKKNYRYFLNKNAEFDEEEDVGYGEIARFSDLKRSHLEMFVDKKIKQNPSSLSYIAPRVLSVEGGVVISQDGCTYYHVLVTRGEMTGTIWDVSFENEFSAIPKGVFYQSGGELTVRNGVIVRNGGEIKHRPEPFTFLEWMHHWLDLYFEAANMV